MCVYIHAEWIFSPSSSRTRWQQWPWAFAGPVEACLSSRQCWPLPPAALGSAGTPRKCLVPLCSPVVQMVYVPWDEPGLQDEKTEKLQYPEQDISHSARRTTQAVSIPLLELPSFIPWEIFSVLHYFNLLVFLAFYFLSSNQPLGFQSHRVALLCQWQPAQMCTSPAQ